MPTQSNHQSETAKATVLFYAFRVWISILGGFLLLMLKAAVGLLLTIFVLPVVGTGCLTWMKSKNTKSSSNDTKPQQSSASDPIQILTAHQLQSLKDYYYYQQNLN